MSKIPFKKGPECDLTWDQILIGDLREARRSTGWSQKTLGSKIGVDAQTIKRLEKGVGSMPTLIAVMAAITLKADADIYLLRGRLRFLNSQGARHCTPFSLMLLTLGAAAKQKDSFMNLVPGYWLARYAA